MTDRELPATLADASAGNRRPYSAPSLVQYGSVAKLTQSGGSTSAEGTVPAKSMMCL
ncbi:MAG TPA: lasso RiPP family leader peptide-containing protein [Vicinamibacterales bacterium]|jgi:hypothetical protein